MIKLLHKISNWKFIVPSFMLFGIMTLYVFPQYQLQLNIIAGEEAEPLDVRFSYSLAEVNHLFDELGNEGRDLYRIVVGRIDMIYPFTYVFFLGLTLAYVLKKLSATQPKLIFLALLPAAGALFDYLENFNTLNLLMAYPWIHEQDVAWGERLTRVKHVTLLLSIGLIIVSGIVLLGKKYLRSRQI